jgi:carbamoyl-phosphate synthase small subunit
VQSYVSAYSHHAATRLRRVAWPAASGIPKITGIDTRTLTRKLREVGTMKAGSSPKRWTSSARETQRAEHRDARRVSLPGRAEGADPPRQRFVRRSLLIDVGAKDNIVRSSRAWRQRHPRAVASRTSPRSPRRPTGSRSATALAIQRSASLIEQVSALLGELHGGRSCICSSATRSFVPAAGGDTAKPCTYVA